MFERESKALRLCETLFRLSPSLKRGALRRFFGNFGTFYIDEQRSGTVFKFNPAQRLRALFGWSSTYKGEL